MMGFFISFKLKCVDILMFRFIDLYEDFILVEYIH